MYIENCDLLYKKANEGNNRCVYKRGKNIQKNSKKLGG